MNDERSIANRYSTPPRDVEWKELGGDLMPFSEEKS